MVWFFFYFIVEILFLQVQKVLLDLDMQAIKDNQAKKLSGGQKRKLSLGIAVLGNPKVNK